MRIVRFIVSSLVLLAGLIGALILMAIGLVAFVFLRLFGRPASVPKFKRPVRTGGARPSYADRGDVIDVEATEVKDRT